MGEAVPALLEALEGFLATVDPTPPNLVRSELARQLAEATLTAKPYSITRIAGALNALLYVLEPPSANSPEAIAAKVRESLRWLDQDATGDG